MFISFINYLKRLDHLIEMENLGTCGIYYTFESLWGSNICGFELSTVP